MPGYYDDNFGWYEIESEEDVEFYFENQKKSVKKKCSICGREVKILPQYDKCNSCTDKIEKGWDG